MDWLEAVQRIQALERRVAGMLRHGAVKEVDTAKGLARYVIAPEGEQEFLSPWIPYAQVAGPGTGLKIHNPPTVGQNGTLFSPSGDLRQAVALPMTWSDQAQQPGTTADPALTYGDVRFDIAPGSVKTTIGGTIFEVTADKVEASIGGARLTMTADEFKAIFENAKFEGGSLKHNVKEVGDTHKHIDSMPGPDKTGVPE